MKAIKNIFLRYSRLRRMVKVVSSAERYEMDVKKTKVIEWLENAKSSIMERVEQQEECP